MRNNMLKRTLRRVGNEDLTVSNRNLHALKTCHAQVLYSVNQGKLPVRHHSQITHQRGSDE